MTMEFEKESVKPDDEQDIQPDRKLSTEAAQTTPDSSEHMSKHLPGVKARESEYIPPNGGLAAWLCVLAGFFVFVNSWYAPAPPPFLSPTLRLPVRGDSLSVVF